MSGGVGDRGRGLELVKRSEKGVKSSQLASPAVIIISSCHRVFREITCPLQLLWYLPCGKTGSQGGLLLLVVAFLGPCIYWVGITCMK